MRVFATWLCRHDADSGVSHLKDSLRNMVGWVQERTVAYTF